MKTSFPINTAWRICTFVSFIGGIILIFRVNYGRKDISLSVVESIVVPTAESDIIVPIAESDISVPIAESNISVPIAESNISVPITESNISVPIAESNISVPIAESNISVPIAESSISVPIAESNISEFTTSTTHENKKPLDIKKEECDIFNGEWVYNPKESPLYKGQKCPFLNYQVSCQRNGRPDINYEKWSWEGKGCKIPRFNARDMLKRLKGKRMIIVGDSLNRNQWESLACLLYSAVTPSRAYLDVRRGVFQVFRALDYHCSVEFYWSPFLVQLETKQNNGRRILKLDKLSASAKEWKGADIMVFNTGHWWVHRGRFKAWDLYQHHGKLVENMELDTAFSIAMNAWAHWIDKNVNTAKTLVFFRSISPEHKGKQWCYNKTQPMRNESFITTFPKSIVETVERTIGAMRTPVKYLNITKLSEYRIEAHPAIYATKQGEILITDQQRQPESFADCSHWCLPGVPDTWNRLLYASMVLSNSRNKISTSSHFIV